MISSSGKRIRVLSLCQVEGRGGGADRIVFHSAASVNPARVRITVCCLTTSDDTSTYVASRAADLGIDFVELRERSRFDRQVMSSLVQIVRERSIDIVHAHSYKPTWLCSRLAKQRGITPLTTCHGFSGNSYRERFLYYPLERLILRRFPCVIAVSEKIRDTLAHCGCQPSRLELLHNGVDPNEYRRCSTTVQSIRRSLEIQSDDLVVGAVGRLSSEKRVDVLLEAVRQLQPQHPRLVVLIAGDGPLREELAQQIRTLPDPHRCQLLGHRTDIREVYHAFDLLAQSSDTEGTPTVVLEAMALNIPVVATDVGGTSELLRDKVEGILVPRRDPAALAVAIERTFEQPAATAARVQAARNRIETELSFEARTKKLCAIYEKLRDAGN